MAITDSGVQTIRSAAERAYSKVTDARVSPILLLALLEDFDKIQAALQQIADMQLLSHTALDNQMQAIARAALGETNEHP
jgi:gamma-glutamylcysteine synthetase